MATQEQIDKVFEHIMARKPSGFQKLTSDVNTGIGAVLKLLREKECVSLGIISERLAVSEARVTALVRKMIKKGYIVKESDKSDARVTNIKLTQLGKQTAENLKDTLRRNIAAIADEVGIEKLIAYLKLTDEIDEAVKKLPSPPDIN